MELKVKLSVLARLLCFDTSLKDKLTKMGFYIPETRRLYRILYSKSQGVPVLIPCRNIEAGKRT